MLARDELGQIFALLRLAAVAMDLVDAEIRMRAVGQADRGRAARNLLHGDAMRQIAEPRTAVFLLDGDAGQAELAQPRPQVARKLVLAVDRIGARRDLVLENRETVSRNASTSSPRPKSNPRQAFGIIAVSP